MKKIITSDWQLADNPRDRYRTNWVLHELPKLIEKYKPDQLLVLGDITEEKGRHPASLVNEIVTIFTNLSKLCQVIILQGNHDFIDKEHPYFEFLSKFDNIYWVSKPAILDNCLYLPHTRDYKKDWKDVDFKENYDFVFAHNIFTGVKANGQTLSGIPTTVFPADVYTIIAGDVHEPQTVDENIIYVGSPTLCDFGDDYEPRLLLVDDLLIKSIKVKGPQKRLVDIAYKKDSRWESNFNHCNDGDIVKVRVALSRNDVDSWNDIRAEIEQWCADCKLILNTIQPIVEYEQGARAKIVKGENKSDFQFLEAYVKRNGLDEKSADVGRQLMKTE